VVQRSLDLVQPRRRLAGDTQRGADRLVQRPTFSSNSSQGLALGERSPRAFTSGPQTTTPLNVCTTPSAVVTALDAPGQGYLVRETGQGNRPLLGAIEFLGTRHHRRRRRGAAGAVAGDGKAGP